MALLSLTLLAACNAPPRAKAVTRQGGQLLLDGQPYRFKGLNIYNANSRDNCSYNMQADHVLDASLNDIGPRSQNAFRAWFYQELASTRNGARDWSAFDHTLAEAAAHNQRVVVTLADQWGDCETAPGSPGTYKDQAWYESGYKRDRPPGLRNTYRDWVQQVVTRYKTSPAILAWQLMNEAEDAESLHGPCALTAAATLKAWASDMAHLVKSLDQRHLVSIGTIGGGQCGTTGTEYQSLHDLPDVDLCEYHDYGNPRVAIPGDAQNGLQVRLDQCRALGKPLFIGEMGIERQAAGSLAQRAALFDAKLAAQAERGVAGWLLWAWADRSHAAAPDDQFAIGPGDPTLRILNRY